MPTSYAFEGGGARASEAATEKELAATIDLPTYQDALVVLGTAGVVVPLVRRWGLNPVLGYLGAGVLLGPYALGSLQATVPIVNWVTIHDAKNLTLIAELGIVFLLFLIGLELSYERLMTMRRLVLGMGTLQVVVTGVLIASVLAAMGLKPAVAVVLGACLALSSTAIVLDVLSRQGRLTSSTGRTSFSILLAQDLAVIPILMLVSILGADAKGSVLASVGTALLQAVVAVAAIVLVGRLLLRPLFRLVAGVHSSELFIATILFVIVGTGVVAALAGMSMALGAFVAGLLLAETEYRKSVEATIEPFKGLLLGVFFFTVGMGIDVREIARQPALILACAIGLIAVKAVIVLGLARLFGQSRRASIESALLLGPGGEFAFVGIGLATTLAVVPAEVAGVALVVTSLTMALIPTLAVLGPRLSAAFVPPRPPDPALALRPSPRSRHAIVVGYGRVGRVVTELLEEHGVSYTATDSDAYSVAEMRAKGHDVYYGNASDTALLKACGVMDAAAVIVTIHSQSMIDTIVTRVRELRPDVLIVSRARDADHARHLYEIGVSDAVPETIEASLQLSEAALVGLGVPTGAAIASIHEHRDVVRAKLQKAARSAGHAALHSVRSAKR
jgi:CPA2 family monovalent cation:H+ antiporter-2